MSDICRHFWWTRWQELVKSCSNFVNLKPTTKQNGAKIAIKLKLSRIDHELLSILHTNIPVPNIHIHVAYSLLFTIYIWYLIKTSFYFINSNCVRPELFVMSCKKHKSSQLDLYIPVLHLTFTTDFIVKFLRVVHYCSQKQINLDIIQKFDDIKLQDSLKDASNTFKFECFKKSRISKCVPATPTASLNLHFQKSVYDR